MAIGGKARAGGGAAAAGAFALRCPRCKSLRVQLGYTDPPLHLRLVGVRDLLCNNCNLEFRGFALPGRIRRGRSEQADDTPNLRRAPRYKVRLPAQVRQIVRGHFGGDAEYSPAVRGHTRDVSRIGLALVLPAGGVEGYDLFDAEKRLQVWIGLPTGTIVMQVALVNHAKVGGAGPARVVVGAHIRNIGEAERAALHRYIETLG